MVVDVCVQRDALENAVSEAAAKVHQAQYDLDASFFAWTDPTWLIQALGDARAAEDAAIAALNRHKKERRRLRISGVSSDECSMSEPTVEDLLINNAELRACIRIAGKKIRMISRRGKYEPILEVMRRRIRDSRLLSKRFSANSR